MPLLLDKSSAGIAYGILWSKKMSGSQLQLGRPQATAGPTERADARNATARRRAAAPAAGPSGQPTAAAHDLASPLHPLLYVQRLVTLPRPAPMG